MCVEVHYGWLRVMGWRQGSARWRRFVPSPTFFNSISFSISIFNEESEDREVPGGVVSYLFFYNLADSKKKIQTKIPINPPKEDQIADQ